MKQTIIYIILAIIVGLVLGKYMFNQYDKKIQEAFLEKDCIYILQQGVYQDEKNIKGNIKEIKDYLIVLEENFYHVYVGMTKKKENAYKMEEVYTKMGNDIYIKEIEINVGPFLEILKQYDLLLGEVNQKKDILEIQKQVLNKYKELVLINEKY
ncbi:MAG: hypothetical protein ACOXZR_04845 [Bacilli bacterium]